MNYTGPYTASFTVDVEDGISIAMRDAFGVQIKPTDRVVRYTEKILDIYSGLGAKGTFFTLGTIAEHFPDLVKKISDEGHELAVHGYNHLLFNKMTPELAFEEVDRAKKLIEDISGKEVFGHRAPAFSINSNTSWALDVLARCGFKYDSSVMPCRSLRYGWPDFNRNITRVRTGNGHEIIEVPMSTVHVLGRDIPACGGSYLRLLPFKMSEKFFNSIARERHPVVYIHPYELDNTAYPDYFFEELKQAPLKTRLALRSNWLRRGTVGDKFKKLMQIRESVPLIDIVNSSESRGEIELFDLGE
jgi:polysaccharide deacetylase family protein (PEP-CTERM system associated)